MTVCRRAMNPDREQQQGPRPTWARGRDACRVWALKRGPGLALALGLALGLIFGSSGPVQAARIQQASPQGEVAQVRQVRLQFDEAVVTLGDPRLPAPASVACQGAEAAGSGRWTSPREWVFDFRQALPPGTRCQVRRLPDWRPLAGDWTGPTEFRFSTGGPAVARLQPWPGSTVEEEPYFVAELTGPVVEAELPRHAWCEVDGLAERLPLQLVTGADRDTVLKARNLDKRPPGQVLVFSCGRPLPPQAKLRIVWGPGIRARNAPQVQTRDAQPFSYQVRERFSAEFSCERERANAPCMPIRPLLLRFSAPLSRALAEQIRLKPAAGGAALAPFFDKDDKSNEVQEVQFKGPLAERASFSLELPPALKDSSGRSLANAGSFPLRVSTGDAPPIAKFAAAPFGVVERGPDTALPVTLRHVQGDLRPQAAGGILRIKRLDSDADVIAWFRKLRRYHETQLSARDLGRPQAEWYQVVQEAGDPGQPPVRRRVERVFATRELSLLAQEPEVRRLALPQLQGGDPRPFEVVGIPLPDAGYQVLELESRALGQALLDKAAPMYVRTGVLVTNLGVHFKQGPQDALVWVTTLDRGRPVAAAEVVVSDCQGRRLWNGRTDGSGLARVAQRLEPAAACTDHEEALFVSARAADAAGGGRDMAFVFSGWNRGIEPWRFNLPTGDDAASAWQAHTVFDRTLLRAGETVSMKTFVRRQGVQGLALPSRDELPTQMKLIHDGSGQETTLPLTWANTRSSALQWPIPPTARLGLYRVELDNPQAPPDRRRRLAAGEFRVEEFRVPLLDARLFPPPGNGVAPRELALPVQLNFANGGGVANAALRASALLRSRDVQMPGYEDFQFQPPQQPQAATAEPAEENATAEGDSEGRLLVDKRALATDGNGAARFVIPDLPKIGRASDLLAEISFNDPNGETQTVAQTVRLWPAAVVPAIKAGRWVSNRGQARFSALALDTTGKPIKGQALEVRGRLAQHSSSRKRLVGGFYAYDNRTDYKDLGRLCSGRSDEHGLLACSAELDSAGEVELIVSARDAEGRVAEAATSLWVTRQGELWFEQDNDDRIEVLAEKKRYEPGDTARLQVRMPYREATALVTVERAGVIDSRVITLRGDDPSFDLPLPRAGKDLDHSWAPNVYVSVLALRGRVRDVPWYSFFAWGWKAPLEWARAYWYEGREYQAPTAMVDLAKPSFKLGVAALEVGLAEHELQVSVQPDHAQYGVRGKALVRVKVSQGGQPVSGADLAFAAVDEGLLALRDNTSWQLLQGLLRPQPWGVETSTLQSEIIGRRHYGRKAVAAGGGGGKGATRELFDTLLLWRPSVTLDARGEALIELPLNDSLTAFRLVAVADAGAQRFGTGSARISVTQDLQILSGLPPVVRDGDRFQALLTLRNTTAREMKLRATLQGTVNVGVAGAVSGAAAGGASGATSGAASGAASVATGSTSPAFDRRPLALPAQDLVLPPGAARELTWAVEVPADAFSISWEAAAEETGGAARDRLKVTQWVAAAVPQRVLQASLQQLDGTAQLPVAAPADGLLGAGGVPRGALVLGLQPRLSGALPGLRRFFEEYAFVCLEQKVSKAVGLRDHALWAQVANALPGYLDDDGLASYFPPRAEDGARGSDRLTAYLLAATHEAGFELPAAARDRMLDGLVAFVEGRIQRRFWSPRADMDVRRLAAIEALSRHGRAQARWLATVNLTPNQWPTAAVIDWLQILRRVDGIADRNRRLDEAQQILRARLDYAGSTLRFSTEADDHWWWLMDSPDANAARLILALLDDPAWRDELPRLVTGALARQQRGAWQTTTANLWGSLALDKFSQRFESTPVSGRSVASLGAATQVLDWAAAPQGGRLTLPWPARSGGAAVAASSAASAVVAGNLSVTQQGSGKPWLSVQALAAVPLLSPLNAGYAVKRTVTAVERKQPDRWSRGDILRVRLEVAAQADMSWVVLSDPVPGGATILASGLGRDAQIAARGERREGTAWSAYEERSFEAFRSYFEYLPRGTHVVEYTLRLNNPGRFALPPTRVEAMYAPDRFGEAPNAALEVAP